MPATWAQISKELGYGLISPKLADQAINAGAYYMGKLRRQWRSKRSEDDRHWLAAASYNAGLGNILKAQKKCSGAIPYAAIIKCLPKITGRHAKETITYVDRIIRWRAMMNAGF